MDADPQDAPRRAGLVVRRVLLRRNTAADPETAQLVAAAVQAVLRAGARVFLPPAASRCSYMARAIRPGACSCLITGNRSMLALRRSRRWHPAMVGVVAR
jgi:hypothetical protein